jgi:hypothetical protein
VGVEVQLYIFIMSALHTGELSASMATSSLQEQPLAPAVQEAAQVMNWYECNVYEKKLCPCQELKVGHPTHSLVTILNQLTLHH